MGASIVARAMAVCAEGLSVALLTACFSSLAYGDPIQQYSQNYGSLSGDTVAYQNIQERTLTTIPPAPPSNTAMKMGQPVSVNDDLLFLPANGLNIYAGDANGGSQFTDSLISMVVSALAGHTIDNFSLTEKGDYTISAGTADTNASWKLGALQLLVTEIDHDPTKLANPLPVNPSVAYTVTPTAGTPLTPNGIQFTASSAPGNGDIDVSANFSVDAALAAAGITGHATKLALAFDNTLTAQSQSGTYAYISKKELYLGADSGTVPEPGTLTLLGAAGLGLVGLGWRRRRQPVRRAAG